MPLHLRMDERMGLGHRIVWSAVLILCSCLQVARADVNAGIAAYHRGEYATAAAEFKLAAKRDDPFAQNMLGIMYAEGQGLARDDKLAANLFFKAQVLGSLEASANLGRMYAEGRGVAQDNRMALQLFREAAQGGYRPAMLRLAEILENGLLGVTPNGVQANDWRNRARNTAAGGDSLRSGPTAAAVKAAPSTPGKLTLQAAVKPAGAAVAVKARADQSKTEIFEKQLLERLEKYRQRERKLLVASTDTTPPLAAYLKELRSRVTTHLKGVLPASAKPLTVSLLILADGNLKGVELDQGSGDAALDLRVVAALKKLGQFAALPAATAEVADVLGVTLRLAALESVP